MAKEDVNYGPDALKIRENMTVDPKGRLSVSREGLRSVLDDHGCTAEVENAYLTGHDHLYGGAGQVVGEVLIERIKEAQAAGNDPSGIQVTMSMPTKGGVTEVRGEASRTFQNRMGKEGAPPTVTHYGRLGVHIETKRRMPKSVAESLASTVADMLAPGGAAEPAEAKVKLPSAS